MGGITSWEGIRNNRAYCVNTSRNIVIGANKKRAFFFTLASYEFLTLRLINERNKATRVSHAHVWKSDDAKRNGGEQAVYYVPSLITAYRSLLKLPESSWKPWKQSDCYRYRAWQDQWDLRKKASRIFFLFLLITIMYY